MRVAKAKRKARILNFFMYSLYATIAGLLITSAVFITLAIIKYS
jgi:hypothetical protein